MQTMKRLRLVGVPKAIRREHFPNTSLELYHYAGNNRTIRSCCENFCLLPSDDSRQRPTNELYIYMILLSILVHNFQYDILRQRSWSGTTCSVSCCLYICKFNTQKCGSRRVCRYLSDLDPYELPSA
jgi:hypothetical protein